MQKKTDNRTSAHGAKLEMRRAVLAAIGDCRVFEGFCGPRAAGSMSEVWAGATLHTACDERYAWPDDRTRFVGDTPRVMRAIDLQAFNVFDLDAYGSPWAAMLILAARRTWTVGERGAVVLTDGSGRKSKFGTPPHAVAELLGMRVLPPTEQSAVIHERCTAAWLARAGVTQLRRWVADSTASGQPMIYSAVVFEGRGNAMC